MAWKNENPLLIGDRNGLPLGFDFSSTDASPEMDRNGLSVVFIFSFLMLADFSDASLTSNHRNFAVKKRDSVPVTSLSFSGS